MQNEINENSLNRTIDELVSKGCITKSIAEKIKIHSIIEFFNSDLGKLLRDKKNTVLREWPFTYAASVYELHPNLNNSTDEKIIVQGIIDMLVRTPNEAVIIDFKTDRVKPADVSQRAENYASQIKWYCRATGEILGVKKVEGWLYFLNADMQFKVV